MRFTLFELRKRSGYWALSVVPDEADREATQTEPHSMGFYHAPRRHTVGRSLSLLKKRLIEDRRNVIKTLTREIEEIESVELVDHPDYRRPKVPLYYEFPTKKAR